MTSTTACRAKNPRSCRVHGVSDFETFLLKSRLKLAQEIYLEIAEVADKAAAYEELIRCENQYYATVEGQLKLKKWLNDPTHSEVVIGNLKALKKRVQMGKVQQNPASISPQRWSELPLDEDPPESPTLGELISHKKGSFLIFWNSSTCEVTVSKGEQAASLIGSAISSEDALASSTKWYNTKYLRGVG